jgi:hypothetical protein
MLAEDLKAKMIDGKRRYKKGNAMKLLNLCKEFI